MKGLLASYERTLTSKPTFRGSGRQLRRFLVSGRCEDQRAGREDEGGLECATEIRGTDVWFGVGVE